jgi:hypothetical protein
LGRELALFAPTENSSTILCITQGVNHTKARPTILLVEPETTDMISARKLVLETAKFNVLNAYSAPEARLMFEKFNAVDAAVLHAEVHETEQLARIFKQQRAELPVIALRPSPYEPHDHVDHVLSSHAPEELLSLLRKKFGDPRNLAAGTNGA